MVLNVSAGVELSARSAMSTVLRRKMRMRNDVIVLFQRETKGYEPSVLYHSIDQAMQDLAKAGFSGECWQTKNGDWYITAKRIGQCD